MNDNSWKDPWLAVFLSKLFPGAGQIYGGNKTKGIVFIAIWLLLFITGITCCYIFLSSDEVPAAQLSGLIFFIVFVAVLVISIYVLFDAYITAKKHNLNYQLNNKIGMKKDPWLAVFLSYIFPGLGQFYNRQILKGIVFVLITVFLYILIDISSSIDISYLANISHPIDISYVFFILMIPWYFIALKDAFESSERKNSSDKKFLICENKIIKIFIIVMILVDLIPISEITKKHFFQAFKLPSGSMLPTLEIGDRILIDKTTKTISSIKKGDIIVFKYPLDKEKSFIKRVIAVSGNTIESKDKNIYINGVFVEEQYAQRTDSAIFPKEISTRDNFGPFVVPENSFFVMGDNRDQSADSRHWGYIPKNDVLGKAFKIYWSWDRENNNARWERIGKAIQN